MRYDKEIVLVRTSEPIYDDVSGDYSDGETVRDKRMASVANTGLEVRKMLYGDDMRESYTIQVQGKRVADHIEMDGKELHIDDRKTLRTKTVFVVSEVKP